MTHICVNKLTIIGSDNGLSPGRRQAIIWTNAGISSIGHMGTNFSEIVIEIQTFSFKKIHLKMLSGKWRPFCLGLNVLRMWIPQLHDHHYLLPSACPSITGRSLRIYILMKFKEDQYIIPAGIYSADAVVGQNIVFYVCLRAHWTRSKPMSDVCYIFSHWLRHLLLWSKASIGSPCLSVS